MADHDRMHGVLGRQFGIDEAILALRVGLMGLGAEDVPTGMNGTQSLQRFLQAVRQRVVGLRHASKHRIAASRRDLAREQDRPQRRNLIVALIGMPAAADVGGLRWLLPHFRNLRVARNGLEKAVDVDSAHRFGKRDVLRGRQILIAEEDDAVLVNACRISAAPSASGGSDRSMPSSSAPSAPDVGRTSNRVFRMMVLPALERAIAVPRTAAW